MPIPVHPDLYVATVVIPSDVPASAGPFTNTFYFQDTIGGRSHAVVAAEIRDVLDDFYDTTYSGRRITQEMSARIDHANVAYKVYDLGDTVPRIPVTLAATWQAPAAVGVMPNECSIVLSFHAGQPTAGGGTLDKNLRGRIYLGPLNVGTISATTPAPDAQIASATMLTILEAAEALAQTTVGDVRWMQYSRAEDAFSSITQCFVDNSFDTQRRRGAEPTSRLDVVV